MRLVRIECAFMGAFEFCEKALFYIPPPMQNQPRKISEFVVLLKVRGIKLSTKDACWRGAERPSFVASYVCRTAYSSLIDSKLHRC